MNKSIISILKYLISLAVALGLFWYVYREQNMTKLLTDLREAKPLWLIASGVMAIISHWSRGYRWAIALKPLGYQPRKSVTFVAVMIGYFANFFVPRLGEVARCSVLKRTEDIPVNVSFGAVVAERAIDLLILLSLTVLTVLIEFDKVGEFIMTQFSEKSGAMTSKLTILGFIAGIGLVGLGILYMLRERLMKTALFEKVKTFALGMKEGLFSIKKLEASSRWFYVLHTINIWVMYYTMTYVLFFSLDVTSNLSMMCGLTVLIMGGIGMALPSPGGVGTYHVFVSAALLAYGLSQEVGVQFAFLMHSTQTVTVLSVGAICFLITLFIPKRKIVSSDSEENKM